MDSLFPDADDPPPQAARLAPKLRALADRGTSCGYTGDPGCVLPRPRTTEHAGARPGRRSPPGSGSPAR